MTTYKPDNKVVIISEKNLAWDSRNFSFIVVLGFEPMKRTKRVIAESF